MLPELSYPDFEPTQTTLHLFSQIIGKIQLRYTRHRNHWWNMTFVPSSRGIATRRMRYEETLFDAEFDFIDHQLVIRSNRAHAPAICALRDGLSVREFYRSRDRRARGDGVPIEIYAKPYGMGVTTPFAQDVEHQRTSGARSRLVERDRLELPRRARRVRSALSPARKVPVQLFWHSFDLAMSRYSGKHSDRPPSPNPVEREAYSHEVIAFGFWSGDATSPSRAIIPIPHRNRLRWRRAVAPRRRALGPSGTGHLGLLPYAAVRGAPIRARSLLEFFESGYEAGTKAAGWNAEVLANAIRCTGLSFRRLNVLPER